MKAAEPFSVSVPLFMMVLLVLLENVQTQTLATQNQASQTSILQFPQTNIATLITPPNTHIPSTLFSDTSVTSSLSPSIQVSQTNNPTSYMTTTNPPKTQFSSKPMNLQSKNKKRSTLPNQL